MYLKNMQNATRHLKTGWGRLLNSLKFVSEFKERPNPNFAGRGEDRVTRLWYLYLQKFSKCSKSFQSFTTFVRGKEGGQSVNRNFLSFTIWVE